MNYGDKLVYLFDMTLRISIIKHLNTRLRYLGLEGYLDDPFEQNSRLDDSRNFVRTLTSGQYFRKFKNVVPLEDIFLKRCPKLRTESHFNVIHQDLSVNQVTYTLNVAHASPLLKLGVSSKI